MAAEINREIVRSTPISTVELCPLHTPILQLYLAIKSGPGSIETRIVAKSRPATVLHNAESLSQVQLNARKTTWVSVRVLPACSVAAQRKVRRLFSFPLSAPRAGRPAFMLVLPFNRNETAYAACACRAAWTGKRHDGLYTSGASIFHLVFTLFRGGTYRFAMPRACETFDNDLYRSSERYSRAVLFAGARIFPISFRLAIVGYK